MGGSRSNCCCESEAGGIRRSRRTMLEEALRQLAAGSSTAGGFTGRTGQLGLHLPEDNCTSRAYMMGWQVRGVTVAKAQENMVGSR